MQNTRLNIITGESKEKNSKEGNHKSIRREEMRAKFERLWHLYPEQFDPRRNSMEEERIERTWHLLSEFVNPTDQLAVDLGCGMGLLSQRLTEAGANVHAVDVATTALKKAESLIPRVASVSQDCLPKTLLKDDAYDIVLCTDVIAYLQPSEFRLFMAELSRLVRREGFVVCSTPIDFNSEDAVERFAELAETEFTVQKWVFSYHRLYIRLCALFEAPSLYVQAKSDPGYRFEQLNKRSGFGRAWFCLNSSPIPSLFWRGIQWMIHPVFQFLKHNRFLMFKLEKICHAIWDEAGISHAIFIAKRRPLTMTPEKPPEEMKHKKQLWE